MFVKTSLLAILFFNIRRAAALDALPSVPDNNIQETEAVIRLTINKLFTLLNLDPSARAKFNHFTIIHNYLALLTLRDYNVLNDIAGLTRVDITGDNATIFTTELFQDIIEFEPQFKVDDVNNETDVALNYIENLIDTVKTVRNEIIVLLRQEKNLNRSTENDTVDVDILLSDFLLSASDAEDKVTEYDGDFWSESSRRIYEGTTTKIKHYPFMASISVFDKFQCAGSIIKSDLIITAASCLQLAHNNRFFRENPKFLSARIGSSFYMGGGEVIPVTEVYFYPSYNPRTLKDNLAIMRLQYHIQFKKKYVRVKKIKFDRNAHSLPTNTDGITIVGWGAKTRSNILQDPFTNKISCTVLDFYDLRECQDVYSKEFVTNRCFCAGFITAGSGACNHDLGGPGIVNGILTGIISFGSPRCGEKDEPTVFVKLGYYAKWIDEILEMQVVSSYVHTTLPTTPWIITDSTTERPEMILPIDPNRRPEPLFETEKLQNTTVDNIVDDILEVSDDKQATRNGQKQDEMFKKYLKNVFGSEENISSFIFPGMRQSHMYKTFLKNIDTLLPKHQEVSNVNKESEEREDNKNSAEKIANADKTVEDSPQSIEDDDDAEDDASANEISPPIPDKSEQNIGEEQSEKENVSENKKMNDEDRSNELEDEDANKNTESKREGASKEAASENNDNDAQKLPSKETLKEHNLSAENSTIFDESNTNKERTSSKNKNVEKPFELKDIDRIILEQKKALKALKDLERHLNSGSETSGEIEAAKRFADEQIKLAQKQVADEKKAKLNGNLKNITTGSEETIIVLDGSKSISLDKKVLRSRK